MDGSGKPAPTGAGFRERAIIAPLTAPFLPETTTPLQPNILAGRRRNFHDQAIKIPSKVITTRVPHLCLVIARQGSLGVALGAQPTNATIASHPVIDIGLAVKAGDFSGFSAGVLSHDSPIVVRLTDRSEDHFCFCHDTLCRRYVQKTNSALLAAAR